MIQGNSRIRQAIDDSLTVRVDHSKHPLATPSNDRGRADANLSMKRMMLLLKPSEQQHAALSKLIDSQHDPKSLNYQNWLTPGQYAAQFGPTPGDLNQITGWLEQHGFEVAGVAHGGQWIEFSGTAGQVEKAFHTEIHNYLVKGEQRVANSTDIALPQALSAVVRGVLSLHNFPVKPTPGKVFQVQRDPTTGAMKRVATLPKAVAQAGVNSELTINNSNGTFHLLTPGDWSRIYNTAPLLKKGIDGAGISIAVVGSDSDVQLSDIRAFRQLFKLPAKDPILIVNGTDPGFFLPGEEEADLDIEWAGAIAPDATIKFVTSASTASTAGFALSIAHIVDNRLAPIMTNSIGGCELFLGPALNAFLDSAFQQAAAEGISVISAAGDTGAAGCDPQISFTPAFFGQMVNGAASTPYNVAVGGTMFAENGLAGNYWNANNRSDLSSVKGYIPETVWNETCDPTVDPDFCFGSGLFFLDAGSGGSSNCVQSTFGFDANGNFIIDCISGYAKPSWQAGAGVPNDGARDIPDLSLAAAGNNDGYLICVEGSCQWSISQGQTVIQNASIVGGTSAGAPSFAGVMALLEQKKRAYLGLLNYNLYQLAAADDLSACNSSNRTDPQQSSSCVFNDVTTGDNSVPGQPGTAAAAGYDLATGLGSLNAENLVERWDSVNKLRSTTRLTVDQDHTVRHGQPIPVKVAVKPAKGTGAPSGDFSFLTEKSGSVFGGTLNNGVFSGGINNLPGGEYQVKARYAGDAMYEASTSDSVRVKVNPEDAALHVVGWFINFANSPQPIDSPVVYGQPVGLQMDVHGASGIGSPSGSVTVLLDGKKPLGPYPLNEAGNAFVWFDHVPPAGLLPGDHTFAVSYSGDDSFKASNAAPVSVTVRKDGAITILSFVVQQSLDPNVPTVLSAGIPVDISTVLSGFDVPILGAKVPTGTAQLYECIAQDEFGDCAQWKPLGGPLVLSQKGPSLGFGDVQAFYRTSFAAGDHMIKATYSGDANYQAIDLTSNIFSRTLFFTVNPVVNAAIALKQSPSTINVGQATNYVVSIKPSKTGGPVPTGTISLADINTNQVAGPLSLVNGNASFTLPWFQAGQQLLYAIYSGDANYGQLASTAVVTTINPAHPTVTLTPAATRVEENSTTTLKAVLSGGPPNPNPSNPPRIAPAGAEGGKVEYWDSVDGKAPQLLGGAAQSLTVDNGFNSINIFPVVLPHGMNAITVKFLGTLDWTAQNSNSVVVRVTE